MEKWLADRPHHPGAAARQWLIYLYKENRLVKGTFELGGEAVDLQRLTMPILNVYALQDNIIPPPYAKALEQVAILRNCVRDSPWRRIVIHGGGW